MRFFPPPLHTTPASGFFADVEKHRPAYLSRAVKLGAFSSKRRMRIISRRRLRPRRLCVNCSFFPINASIFIADVKIYATGEFIARNFFSPIITSKNSEANKSKRCLNIVQFKTGFHPEVKANFIPENISHQKPGLWVN